MDTIKESITTLLIRLDWAADRSVVLEFLPIDAIWYKSDGTSFNSIMHFGNIFFLTWKLDFIIFLIVLIEYSSVEHNSTNTDPKSGTAWTGQSDLRNAPMTSSLVESGELDLNTSWVSSSSALVVPCISSTVFENISLLRSLSISATVLLSFKDLSCANIRSHISLRSDVESITFLSVSTAVKRVCVLRACPRSYEESWLLALNRPRMYLNNESSSNDNN